MTNGRPMDEDLALIDRFAAGDRDAFDELVLKHQKPLYSLLYRMVSDKEDAADILQRPLSRHSPASAALKNVRASGPGCTYVGGSLFQKVLLIRISPTSVA